MPDRILGDFAFQNILSFRVFELSATLFGWYFGSRNKWRVKQYICWCVFSINLNVFIEVCLDSLSRGLFR